MVQFWYMDAQSHQSMMEQNTKPSRRHKTMWVIVIILALVIVGIVVYIERLSPIREEIRIGEALLKAAKNPSEAEKEAVAKDLATQKASMPEISEEQKSEINNYLNS